MYYTETVAPASSYPNATQFGLDFESTFGSPPNLYAVQAYDATGICLRGIEDAAQAIGGEVPSRREVAQAIRAIEDFSGIAGQYRFDNKGDIAPAQYFIYKVAYANPEFWSQNTIVATLNVEPP
jgi:branched-chain amino acid transport system substrate-binding protein